MLDGKHGYVPVNHLELINHVVRCAARFVSSMAALSYSTVYINDGTRGFCLFLFG